MKWCKPNNDDHDDDMVITSEALGAQRRGLAHRLKCLFLGRSVLYHNVIQWKITTDNYYVMTL